MILKKRWLRRLHKNGKNLICEFFLSAKAFPKENIMKGMFFKGCGKASKIARTTKRKTLLMELFNCYLKGTFNIRLWGPFPEMYPTIRKGIHAFYLVKIEISNDYEYG